MQAIFAGTSLCLGQGLPPAQRPGTPSTRPFFREATRAKAGDRAEEWGRPGLGSFVQVQEAAWVGRRVQSLM